MLKTIEIKNYLLIESIKVDFDNNFNIITGETGSGKSILIGALNLLAGSRVDHKVVGTSNKKCIIEAIFLIDENLKDKFLGLDIDFDKESFFRREILSNGKSRAFINDTPVKLETLKNVTLDLINIQSQNQDLVLNEKSFYYKLIDSDLEINLLREKFLIKYNQYLSKQKIYENLNNQFINIKSNLDYNKFLYNEIDELNLQNNEEESLEQEFLNLKNYDKLKNELNNYHHIVSSEHDSLISLMNNLSSILNKTSSISNDFKTLKNRYDQLKIEFDDIINSINRKSENLVYDPRRFEYVQNRIFKIKDLFLKHNAKTANDLIQVKQNLSKQFSSSKDLQSEVESLKNEIRELENKCQIQANTIFLKRKQRINDLRKDIESIFNKLSMKESRIKFDLDKSDKLNKYGIDNLNVLYSSDKGNNFNKLIKIASGGEKSRILLAINVLFSEKMSLPTLIFDEIDSGTSGKVANVIADLLKRVGNKSQVIAISHLPQVAAKASNHYKVSKILDQNKPKTLMKKLNHGERIKEIAAMISADNITNPALNQALELLK